MSSPPASPLRGVLRIPRAPLPLGHELHFLVAISILHPLKDGQDIADLARSGKGKALAKALKANFTKRP